MFQDIRYALRLWARRPWQTGFAIVALAIGIGANTGVFSVVNALLLRSLPFRQPERLAVLHDFLPPHDSAMQFQNWRQKSTYLSDAALFEEIEVNLGGTRLASRIHAAQTSWDFFSLLGTQPVLGRSFAPEDEANAPGFGLPGRNATAIISYGLWQQLFSGDPSALGATVRIDGHPLTVIGVAPPGFDFPNKSALWKPAAFSAANNGWSTVVRLKPGFSWAQARAAFAVETKRLSPKQPSPDDPHASMVSLRDVLAGPAKNASLIFMGAVLLVLLIACANVANILTARTLDRMPELSVRWALGASGGRLARQLFTECLILSFVATAAGLAVAYWTTSIAAKMDATLEGQSYSLLDLRVLAFTVVISVVTALTFGILPSLYLRRAQVFATRSSSRPAASRVVREALVGAQVMLAILLLAGSVSLGRAFVHLMTADRGYDVNDIVTVNVSLDSTTHEAETRRLPYFEEVLDRVRRLPGVRSASATEFLPFYSSAFQGGPFGLDGRPAARGSTMIPVMSDYFQTMGGRILYGSEFNDAEVRSEAKVAVVNERFALGFGAPEDAIGHQLTIQGLSPWTIIGVVQGMEYETDPTLANGPQVFIPQPGPGGLSLFSTYVVRVNGPTEQYLAQVRDTIQSVDPQVPVFGAKTMQQRLDDFYATPRFYRTAVWFFAALALLLSALGIYAVVSYAVIQRTQEMGVRMALGTTPTRLRGLLLRQGLLTVIAGAIPGLVVAHLSGHFLESLIDGAKPIGPDISVGVILLLVFIASISIWCASRRIARFDITAILRSE
jgi:predicted permease